MRVWRRLRRLYDRFELRINEAKSALAAVVPNHSDGKPGEFRCIAKIDALGGFVRRLSGLLIAPRSAASPTGKVKAGRTAYRLALPTVRLGGLARLTLDAGGVILNNKIAVSA